MTNKTRGSKKTTPRRPIWKTLGLAIAFMGLAAFASPVSQSNLSPVYGSIPSAIYHQKAIAIIPLVAFVVTNLSPRKYMPSNMMVYLPVIAYYIPIIQWALFPLSGRFGAELGPLITEALSYYPLLFMACIATSIVLEELDLSHLPPTIADGIRPAFSYIFFTTVERTSTDLISRTIGKADFMSRSGLNLLIASFYAALARTPYLLINIPGILHTMYGNMHHYSGATNKLVNKTLAIYNYTLLERRDSLTGYISVLEDNVNQFRVLRCDHSLLGGEWLVNDERRAQGQIKRETIYSVFTMLESVRLVEGVGQKDSEANALFIGLGTGTSTAAFIYHGINTTVVELDPVVHEFATKYFDLPGNHTTALEDAASFVKSQAITHPKSYDYIIHDVFTGGAEPTELFTLEFLHGISNILKDEGVVAINYAGDLTLPPLRIVLATIHSIFPTCRAFRDSPPESNSPAHTFINMVVFCTKSRLRPLTFREGSEADWMGSLSRREFIPPAKNLEISIDSVVGKDFPDERSILRRGNKAIIEKYHRRSAVRHWELMRTVLPDAVWEAW
ncbi:uncharacterized protein PV09_04239 [Verruconis gallopava]|uniref:PABS domain-containing protein n=1 Tax=Verruconis gallopava TaxID=253628 RepID=A0A0D2ADF7_9PEZI|nr:uncharacterized protein PV09_04239 [Verruconis gallopava]KIW04480.1 hypothetical protein PV09_04239 [Verruconis gallopava]